ncbi:MULTISPECIES: hypothetical protein [Myroides]|uniref:Uncharacterized protein n=1 Tax=Myroides albus TaxID=2562892 RepID=A0A6I3LLL0_9FLAO|nr:MULTISPECIES: hypothetical protein [Myroides]MTG98160.1 hypothetical protein [Myroides albus]MVX36739.1 hypothetical protein [Myroides sp. LoEW2-1]UVD78648.1 hypothetical protein NWE55_11005 [Myroides albus]
MNLKSLLIQSKSNITFDILTQLDFTLSTKDVIDELKEDLLQAAFDNQIILDIGWYPEFDINGHFSVQVIANYNWEAPLYKENCKSFTCLETAVISALRYCQ